ncbi:uncharacterized protein LOC134775795 [Penaeus indicus]|uniref:uncharacterized protein LOC134775795 n=1 Tax=Penaeus indicus TaxID=29960 RepID=UPI00300D2034
MPISLLVRLPRAPSEPPSGCHSVSPVAERRTCGWIHRNDVGVILSSVMKNKVVEVKRVNNRVGKVIVALAEEIINIVNIYAPQTGYKEEEMLMSISEDEKLVIGRDLDGHIGTADSVLGKTTGNKPTNDKETWWWKQEIQEIIHEKKAAERTPARVGSEQSREANKRAKRDVARAKAEGMSKFFEDLETKEGQRNIFRIAKARDKASKDIVHIIQIKDNNGSVPTREKPDDLSSLEVKKALIKMKNGKGVGPDEILIEAWKCLGDEGVDIILDLLRKIYQHVKIPDI